MLIVSDPVATKRAERKRRPVLRWALSVLVLGLIAFEGYARFPAHDEVPPLSVPDDVEELVLVFHGTGGAREPNLLLLTDRLVSMGDGRPHRVVERYVWAPLSDNIFRAAARGSHVGQTLGERLAKLPRLRSLRLIAHSAGAYLLDPLCEAYRKHALRPLHIEMTFLDPIGTTGTWDYGYGYRNHGRCADFASAYLNLDDPVPGTNAPADHAYNVDVTNSPERAAFVGEWHAWPIKFFADHLTATDATPRLRTHALFPRGKVRVIGDGAGP